MNLPYFYPIDKVICFLSLLCRILAVLKIEGSIATWIAMVVLVIWNSKGSAWMGSNETPLDHVNYVWSTKVVYFMVVNAFLNNEYL